MFYFNIGLFVDWGHPDPLIQRSVILSYIPTI